jgi:hypothetical protein
MTRRFSLALFAVAALAALPAPAKPNYTGDWKMNVSKSSFGEMPAPSSMTSKINHDEPNLHTASKSSSDQGDFEFTAAYTTDGKECTNEIMGSPMKSTVKWEGDVLVINSDVKFGDNDLTIIDRWTLSEDGKTLTIARNFKSAMGEFQQKLVMEKQ